MSNHTLTRPIHGGLPVICLGDMLVSASVARCLGPAGVPVWVLGDAAEDTVQHSRYCTSFVDLGSGDGVQERWLEWLRERPAGEAVVFPSCDDGVELICRHRASLIELGYRPIEANDQVALAMLDKLATYACARTAGIETPRHFALDQVDELDAGLAASGIDFPCMLKPLHSHMFRRRFTQKMLVARDHTELVDACRRVEPYNLKMMVTEIIPGPEDAYLSLHSYLDGNGEPLAIFTKRKLRQYPVGLGMGTYHVTEWNDAVAQVGLQFCQGVGIRGMAVPEFKRDARDGSLKLIECNHRFVMSNELVRRSGVNLPLIAYNRLVGWPVARPNGFREGMYLWYPTGDAKAFLAARRDGQMTLSGWIRSLLHRQHLALFDRSDPGPAIVNWGRRIIARAREAARGVMSSSRRSCV